MAGAVKGRAAADQAGLDGALIELDGTPNKSRLGGHAGLGRRLRPPARGRAARRAAARRRGPRAPRGASLPRGPAAAADAGVPLWRHLGGAEACVLPVPMLNVLN